jgi:hypothetical protein
MTISRRVQGQLSDEQHQVLTPEKAEQNFNLVPGKITEAFFPSRARAIFARLMRNRRWPWKRITLSIP